MVAVGYLWCALALAASGGAVRYDPAALAAAAGLMEAGRLAEARAALEGVIAAIERGAPTKNNDHARALHLLSQIHRGQADYRAGIEICLKYQALLERQGAKALPAARDNLLLLAEHYRAAGDDAAADRTLEAILETERAGGPLHPLMKLNVLVVRAGLAEPDSAAALPAGAPGRRRWEEVALWAKRLQTPSFKAALPPTEVGTAIRSQALALEKLGDAAGAVGLLEGLFERELARKDPRAARETMVELTRLCLARGDAAKAEAAARGMLGLYDAVPAGGPAPRALARVELAKSLVMGGKTEAGREQAETAAAELEQALGWPANEGAWRQAPQFWLRGLEAAYRLAGQLDSALAAMRARLARLPAGTAARADLLSDLGVLCGLAGLPDEAKAALEEVVQYRRTRPERARDLARALNNLAAVEQANGSAAAAEKAATESLEVCQRSLADDRALMAETYNRLATARLANGRYEPAIAAYEEAARHARAGGAATAPLVSQSLLNLALAFKSQGLYERASELCAQSLEIDRRRLGEDSFELAAHHTALASLGIAEGGDLDEAVRHASRALELCERHGRTEHPLAAGAHEFLAQVAYRRGEPDKAAEHWEKALAIHERAGLSLATARTRNYLGRAALERGALPEAERFLQSALALEREKQGSFPVTEFITCSNLAVVFERQGRRPEAEELLRRAIDLVEAPRAATWGADKERAEFFAQFGSAFETLVTWSLEEGRIEDALSLAERGRNRTFLDQLRLAGHDPRDGLEGAAAAELLEEERELSERIQAASARLAALSRLAGADPLEIESRQRELEQLRERFAAAWTRIVSASPAYRGLLAENQPSRPLADWRRLAGDRNALLLYYYLGAEHSYLIMADRAGTFLDFTELVVPEDVLIRLWDEGVAGPPGAGTALADGARAPGGVVRSAKGERVPAVEVPKGALTRAGVGRLVSAYVTELSKREFGAEEKRGPGEIVKSPKGMSLVSEWRQLTSILLPPESLEKVRAGGYSDLVIVPDGPLHQLPFEALLLEEGATRVYLLDRAPPIAYAPSLAVLARLCERRKMPAWRDVSVLTVGNPIYPSGEDGSADEGVDLAGSAAETRGETGAVTRVTRDVFSSLGGALVALPGTRLECERVARAFGPEKVTYLDGARATERAVTEAMKDRTYVHLAAHGLVDERHENLFGAIALTPGPSSGPEDDGFLRLHEINRLRLEGCELAVLSACRTNAGPERPLEAGSSLARAFLTAGSTRVLSSLWNVSDQATAELVGAFVADLAERLEKQEPIDYARAAQTARRRIREDRSRPERAAPYYWAPFVLLGPGQ